MKTIIAGSRTISSYDSLEKVMAQVPWEVTEVVSGTARGVDQLGEQWAEKHSIPIKRFPANWKEHGPRAGYLRKVEMAEYAKALIALWDGSSRGTGHMIDIAKRRGLKTLVAMV